MNRAIFNIKMSERLMKLVNDALITKGIKPLIAASGLREGSIRGIATGSRRPRRRNAYRLALACGASEQDALAIAYECAPQNEAKETA